MSHGRSYVHMLSVAAARLEHDHANPALVRALRDAAESHAKRQAEGMRGDSEQKRIDRQRTLMAMVPDSRAKSDLRGAMLQRAYDLLWDGDCAGCDALIEFLPSLEVGQLLDAWQDDQEGRKPRSPWFHGLARVA